MVNGEETNGFSPFTIYDSLFTICGFRLRGFRLSRGRFFGLFEADADDAAALDALDVEEVAVVLDDLAGLQDVAGLRHQEAGDGRVGFRLGELQLEAAVEVAHRQ